MTDYAEFQIFEGDEFYAEAAGAREEAWQEALRYASQVDNARIDEVTRASIPTPWSDTPPVNALSEVTRESDTLREMLNALARDFNKACDQFKEQRDYAETLLGRLQWTRDRWCDVMEDVAEYAEKELGKPIAEVGGLVGGFHAVAAGELAACDAAIKGKFPYARPASMQEGNWGDALGQPKAGASPAPNGLEISTLRAEGWAVPGPWIACSERLPADETPVLILYRGTIRVGELRWEHPGHEDTYKAFRYWDDPVNDGQCWEWPDVTHWMALPAPPETGHEKSQVRQSIEAEAQKYVDMGKRPENGIGNVPAGWRLKLEGDTCLVQGPGDTGFYVGHEHDRENIASVMLYRFAKAVLSQSQFPSCMCDQCGRVVPPAGFARNAGAICGEEYPEGDGKVRICCGTIRQLVKAGGNPK